MIARKLIAVAVLAAALAASGGAMATVTLNGQTYLNMSKNDLRVACEGLENLSLRSAVESEPEIPNESDPQSYFNLSQLPFTLKDCRDAGIV